MEEVKVNVALHSVQVINRQLVLVMREGTHIAELAGWNAVRIVLAELGLVLLGVVEVLDSVVGAWTIVAERTVVHIVAEH